MKPAKTTRILTVPQYWSDMAMGALCKQKIQAELDRCCEPLFGYHLIKLGPLSAELSCRTSRIQHQINVGEQHPLSGVEAQLSQLPFQEGSVDVCLLAHTLDYCNDPHQVLREVERVLTADGVVIISGFNPLSFYGARHFLPVYKKQLPWSGRMFTPGRIKDWLNLLGFEVIVQKQLVYLGDSAQHWLNILGADCCKCFSFVYFLEARKRRSRLTPIKNRWQLKRRLPVPELEGVPRVNSRLK